MFSTIPSVSSDLTELNGFIEQALSVTAGAILLKTELPIHSSTVETRELKCRKCSHETHDQTNFIDHLVECYEGPQALHIFKRYNLYSNHIQQLHIEARSEQEKHLLVPIKGEPTQILKVPYKSSISRLFAAGAILKNTPEGAFTTSILLDYTKSSQSCTLYIECNALYRNAFHISNLKEISH